MQSPKSIYKTRTREVILDREYSKSWRDYPKDIGFPQTLLDRNNYFKLIGEPLIDYKEF